MNRVWEETILTKSGAVSQNPHLDGFIAEAHHVNSFNAKATALGKPYRAEVLKPGDSGYAKNSVDIVIRGENGEIVESYQSKYGSSLERTLELFAKGDYSGQKKLVPHGQKIEGTTDCIEYKGISSDPLTKPGAKALQGEALTKNNALKENYNAFDTKVLLKQMGKGVALAGVIGAGMSAAQEIGSKLAEGEDVNVENVAKSAVEGGGSAAAKTVAACAIKVAIEKEIVKALTPLKGTPLAPIVAAIDIGISNIKTMIKIGKGDLSLKEGLREMEVNTTAGVVGCISAVNGIGIGATIGSILGPIGTAIGGFVGGVMGGLAGSVIGRAIATGRQAVRKVIWDSVKQAGKTVKAIGARAFGRLGKIGDVMFG